MDDINSKILDKQLYFLIHFLKEKHLLKEWIYDITNKNNMFLTFNQNKHISFYRYKKYLLFLKDKPKYKDFFEDENSFELLNYAQIFYSWSMDGYKKTNFWHLVNDEVSRYYNLIFK